MYLPSPALESLLRNAHNRESTFCFFLYLLQMGKGVCTAWTKLFALEKIGTIIFVHPQFLFLNDLVSDTSL